jgi:SAM-dependent methyltransferase
MLRSVLRNSLGPVNVWRASVVRETIRAVRENRPGKKNCNICGFSGYFRPQGFPVRPEARCPLCSSLERHRLFRLWFRDHAQLFSDARIIHFAAEAAVTRFIKPESKEYVTADIEPGRGDRALDIERLDLADGSFDIVICSHVLEHVDDRRALRELHRILKPNGTALLMVPVIEGWAVTYEDSTKKTPEERYEYFGQSDHVRRYGADVRRRITDAGFSFEEFTAVEPHVTHLGLFPGEKLFIAGRLS